jgi:hypothetical protein
MGIGGVAEKTDECAAEETVFRGFKWAGRKYLERLQVGGYDNAALGELDLVHGILTDPALVRRVPTTSVVLFEVVPTESPPAPVVGDHVVIDFGPYIGTRRGVLLEPDNKCEGGVVPVQLDLPFVSSDVERTHAQGDDLHMLSIMVRAMSEAGFSDVVGIGADTHVQLCFQEAYADDVCGPQYKRQKERIMGKKCKWVYALS